MADSAIRPPQSVTGHKDVRCAGTSCAVCEMRHITFCSVLEPQDISRLAAIVHHSHFAPRQILFQEGDPAHEVFNVLEGAIKVSKSLPDGRTQITGFLFAGDFLGLSTKGNYSYSAEAITDVKLCRFRRRDLTRLFQDFPTLVDRLLTIASDELAVAQEQMLLLGRKTAQEKIVTFLLAMAERAQRRGEPDGQVHLPMSRAEIADYLGLTVETVSRTMTRLREQGIIRLPKPQDVVFAKSFDWQTLAEGAG